MEKMAYTLRVLGGAKFRSIRDIINRIHEKTGKNKLTLFFDIINCGIRYGAGWHDYLIFAFYDMNRKQRKTYVTRMINKRIISMLNDESYSHIFDSKNEFDERFQAYLGREYRDLAKISLEDFKEFMKDKEIIFAKPNIGESGKGIERLQKSEFSSEEELFEYLKDPVKGFGVVEQEIIQHPDMARLYPLAINSLRIVTLVAHGTPYCAYVSCKMGNEGKFVDNMENSGLCCPVDIETGKITAVAHTSKLVVFDKHPYTGVELVGYQLPYIKEAVELCLKAAMEVEQVKYVGWDCCITPHGPIIIEGNDYPGYDFWQLPEQTPDKIGLLPFYQKILPELR